MTYNLNPRPYDLSQPSELMRLLRKCRGYIHTCRREHHGTDFQGRQYAIEALEQVCSGKATIAIPSQERPRG